MSEIKKDGKWVYIAGPFTLGDPMENTRNAALVGDKWVEKGFIPIVPHLSLLWQLISPKTPQWWYNITAEWLKRCDLVYRMLGESKGADEEVALAYKLGIPVLYEDQCHE